VQLQPLVDALAAELLRQPVLHADETPVAMLKPGHGKTHRAYLVATVAAHGRASAGVPPRCISAACASAPRPVAAQWAMRGAVQTLDGGLTWVPQSSGARGTLIGA
jgi:hypothetical protein